VFDQTMQLGGAPGGWRPLTLDPSLTRLSLMLWSSALALFLAVRAVAASEGRRLAGWIGWMAFVGAALGLGRRTLFPSGLIYGFWHTVERGASPFGPIINRNHFAAWAVVAAALTAGCLASHMLRRRERAVTRRGAAAEALADTRGLWLLSSVIVTTAAILATASRAGFIGLVTAAAGALLLIRRRLTGRAMALFLVLSVACTAAALSWARVDNLIMRVATPGSGIGVRTVIWDVSASIARRYPIVGVGAGAFPTAMTVYQPPPREVFYNHAHNQYLELAAEGGLLLGLPCLLVLAGVARATMRGLGADRGSFFWLRAGAGAGLIGLAVLAIWESPFRTPATLMLAAAAAGIAASDARDR
jgi:O-antigen ligase